MRAKGYPPKIGNAAAIADGSGYNETLNRFVSYFANASYTYDGRYTVSGSARNDASNLFGVKTNDKWNPLWSAGIGWNISKEKFFNTGFLSFLKFRGTYGYSGNLDPSKSASTILSFSRASSNAVINIPYASILSSPNPQLRWERVKTINLGLDYIIRNGRLRGTVEYYLKKSTDVLASQFIDPTTGETNIISNSANINGNGFEAIFESQNIISPGFSWNTSFLFNYASYKVARYLFPVNTKGYVSAGVRITPIEGQHPYLVVSYPWAGLDPATGDPQGYIDKMPSKDYLAFRQTEFSEQVIHGPALAPIWGNMLNSVSIRRVSVSFNITYRLGYYFRKPTIHYRNLIINGAGHSDYLNRWQNPGDEMVTNIPSFIYPNPNSNRDDFFGNSSVTVDKGDHIRLSDCRISYSLVRSEKNKYRFKSIDIYGVADNLNVLLWKANKFGMDPDFLLGMATGTRLSFGVKANF